MDERRKYPRMRESATVSLTVATELGMHPSELGWRASFCSAADISMGGVRLSLHDRLLEGSRVTMDIALEDPDEVFIRSGKVAWVRDLDEGFSYTTGIAFADANSRRFDSWREALVTRYGTSAVKL